MFTSNTISLRDLNSSSQIHLGNQPHKKHNNHPTQSSLSQHLISAPSNTHTHTHRQTQTQTPSYTHTSGGTHWGRVQIEDNPPSLFLNTGCGGRVRVGIGKGELLVGIYNTTEGKSTTLHTSAIIYTAHLYHYNYTLQTSAIYYV